MTAGIPKPCLHPSCGYLTHGSYCPEHQPKRKRPSATRRGYDYRWAQLSRNARRRQRFCTDCGIPDTAAPLELDHLPGSWERRAQGLPIRPGVDAEVVCHRCNVKRGAARGENVTRTY